MSYLPTVVRPIEHKRIALDGGGISGRGYWWGQPDSPHVLHKRWEGWIEVAVAAGVFALVLLFIGAQKQSGGVLLVGGCALLLVAGGCVAFFCLAKPRQKYVVKGLVFDTTGRIAFIENGRELVEKDEFDYARYVYLKQPLQELVNIVTIPMKNQGGGHFMYGYERGGEAGYPAYEIVLDFGSGERFYVGQYFDEDNARIVRTQLNDALQQVKAIRSQGPV